MFRLLETMGFGTALVVCDLVMFIVCVLMYCRSRRQYGNWLGDLLFDLLIALIWTAPVIVLLAVICAILHCPLDVYLTLPLLYVLLILTVVFYKKLIYR